ncbi:MAG: gliding motility-associated C-terminal domain-containing protein [Flavobacteriales bacterium]
MPYFFSKKSKALVLAFLIISIRTIAQMPGFQTPVAGTGQSSFKFTPNDWEEIVSERTLNSSRWKTPDGRIICEYSHKPVYFEKEGALQRIDPILTPVENGWIAGNQPFPVFLGKNGEIRTGFQLKEEIIFGNRTVFNGKKVRSVIEPNGENAFAMRDITPGVDKEFQAFENAVKTQYVIHTPMDVDGAFLEIEEEMVLPDGYSIACDMPHGQEKDGRWQGALVVRNSHGEAAGWMQGTFCYDQSKSHYLAGYTFEQINNTNRWIVRTAVSAEWLNANERTYPVVIDPLVVGPLALYAEQFMPSCYIPEYFADSILVTVPAQITVTSFLVTGSFYADPFTTAIMEDGSMYYSSSCNETGTFEVDPPNSLLPGTAYLEAFDMQNPLMCCYPQSCSETSFYLRMHIGRYIPEGDCNYTYIYYTPVTLWPFTAYIEGHTVESFGPQWTVPGAAICSNQCEFTGTIRARYGVPPYTFTHPWMTGSVTVGEADGCTTGQEVEQLPLNWPGCPVFCPDFDEMDVFPPTITDACGVTVADLPMETLNLKPAPDVIFPEPVEVCSNSQETIPLSSCEPGSNYTWSGGGNSGTGNMQILESNETGQIETVNFMVFSSFDGCNSDTIQVPVSVIPSPNAEFEMIPVTPLLGADTDFISQSTSDVGEIEQWFWTINGGSNQSGNSVEYVFETLDSRTACHEVVTEYGCRDTICKDFIVITADVFAPNIFTPNGDGKNDLLEFKYLEFFPENELKIWNRWGTLVVDRKNYDNDWSGEGFSEAVYYYILHIKGANSVDGYFHLVRGE